MTTKEEMSKLPEFTAPNAENVRVRVGEAAGQEIPEGRLYIAGNAVEFKDPLFTRDYQAYEKILTCLPLLRSLEKLGIRSARYDWLAMSRDEDTSKAELLQDFLDNCDSFTDMIKDLTVGRLTGYVAMQIGEFPVGGLMAATFKNGLRHKWRVRAPYVGTVHYDGTRLYRVEEVTGEEFQKAEILDTEPFQHFMLHRPGSTSSPEGDLSLAYSLFPLCKASHEAIPNIRKYMMRYGLPIDVMMKNTHNMSPEQARKVMKTAQEVLDLRQDGNTGGILMSVDEMFKLLEPTGQGFGDMMEYLRWMESVCDQILLGNTLTSKVDDAGRTGDTTVHMAEEDDKVWYNTTQVAETLNTYLIPWAERQNGWDLSGTYIWPAPPGSRARAEADEGRTPDEGDLEDEDGIPPQQEP
jgi:hypothetical protein